ncbi:CheR family methyltransferase [Desulfopila aestuarii]|uniref:PAS domain-containing protein n=1 Tax=Desulfopila aestuarii DSM 18488 TaxID=1121416 RepID=A0A1M7YLN8_9BACT|nr:CheR family methyltransferase [Desulfopila aestuarii]SHO53507.1 PAS domain-containing protein [Desulfopila aestuarii DSM 18488]
MQEVEKFVIVAIGGSAGSLEALETILSDLPSENGLAITLALHSASEHSEGLADFLSKYSSIPVKVVGEESSFEPNNIYIIRFDKASDGSVDRINRFFHQIAITYKDRAVAVVLSGGGRDGVDGAKSIETEGGVVLVQDPATATHPEMPQNILRACSTTEILLPEMMAARVLEIAAVAGVKESNIELASQLHDICHIVKIRTGNDFSLYKPNTVIRRIDRRMKANGLTEVSRYIDLLEESPEEAHALSQDFCIGVTGFFRDPEAFDIVYHDILPKLLSNRSSNDPVRIWDTCCSTGEEAYSLAMLIHEYIAENRIDCTTKIFATDLDEQAIAAARTGIYPETVKLDLGDKRFNTFLTKVNDGFQVIKSLREMVIFAHHNLIKDPPFSRLDMVVCRNFFIYLNADIQKRLLNLFHAMLRPGGYLFMGNSESIGPLTELFATVDKRWRIFQKLDSALHSAKELSLTSNVQMIDRSTRDAYRPEKIWPEPGELATEILVQRYAPPCVVVNDKYEVVHVSTPASHLLEIPIGTPTNDILRMVKKELRPALRAAIHQAISQGEQVAFRGQCMTVHEQQIEVNVTAEPLDAKNIARRLALVTLQPTPVQIPSQDGFTESSSQQERSRKDLLIRNLEEQLRINQEELNSTIQQLEASNDSLMSTNEELMSVNEEFQSTNEELETSKEELQTLNEELLTLNTELQKKVEALDVANNDIENLLNGTQIATLFLDCNLRVKRFTPMASKIFNLVSSDIDRPLEHITGTISQVNISADARRVIETNTIIESTALTVDGDRYYLIRLLPYRTSTGEVEGVVITFVDLTEQHRMEEAIREQAQILDLAPVIVRDLESRIVFWSAGASRLYGFTKNEAIGHISHQLLNTVFPQSLDSIMNTLKTRSAWNGELIHHNRNGEEIFVRSQWVLYRDSAGRPSRTLEVNADNTERKKAEDQYHMLFTTMVNGFALCDIICDEQGSARGYRIIVVNPAFEKLTMKRSDDVVGQDVFDVMTGIKASGAECCRSVLISGQPDIFIYTQPESGKRFEITVFQPTSGQLAMIIEDTTIKYEAESAQKKLELQLAQAQKMEAIGTLAGGIAHDFNNILGAILGYAEMLRETSSSDARTIHDIDQILNAGNRAKELVKQILAFSRQTDIEHIPLQPALLAKEAIKLLRSTLPSSITIEQDIDHDAGVILADPTQFQQILINLCTNAFHAMEAKGGTLRVSVHKKTVTEEDTDNSSRLRPGKYVQVSIRDTGTGIAPEIMEKIFDPYFTTKEVGKGTGMGLAVVLGIVQSSGGYILCDSKPGEGTVFHILMPIVEGSAVEDKNVTEVIPKGNERILLVDDEEMLNVVNKRILEKLGYQITAMNDSLQALNVFRCQPDAFDLVITDQTMPNMSGADLSCNLLKTRPDIPIILCTGYSSLISEEQARIMGIKGFIMKPFTKRDLGNVVRMVLNNR